MIVIGPRGSATPRDTEDDANTFTSPSWLPEDEIGQEPAVRASPPALFSIFPRMRKRVACLPTLRAVGFDRCARLRSGARSSRRRRTKFF